MIRAARLHGAGDLRVEEVNRPPLGPDDVRVEVAYTGICGSDLHEYADGPIAARAEDWDHQIPAAYESAYLPKFIGHETVGRVIETGEHVDVDAGERVAVNLIQGCGQCRECTRGAPHLCSSVDKGTMTASGFAEEIVAPASGIYPIPDDLSFRQAALVEPLAVSLHAVRRGGLAVGDTLFVAGTGAIGLGVIQAGQVAGARRILASEPRPARRAAAEDAGADRVFDPANVSIRECVRSELDGGADMAVETAGVDAALTDAIRATKYGGTTVLVSYFEDAARLHPNDLMETERSIVGALAYAPGTRAPHGEFSAALQLLVDGRLDPDVLVTDVVPLEKVPAAFEELLDPDSNQVKVLVEP